MKGNKPRVLIISSVNPVKGNGTVALNFYRALREAGIEADFLTKYAVEGHPEFLSVFPPKKEWTLRMRWESFRAHYCGKLIPQRGNHSFDYRLEDNPPVSPELVIGQIQKPYDIVYIVFWYRLLSYKTVEAIYDKLHCQIHFRCPDNQPVSGGCHFIGDCPRLREGCGNCPGLKRDNFTAANIQYRKRVMQRVKPIVYGNTHMQMIYRRSALLCDYDRLETVYPMVDNNFFHPIPKADARKSLGIPDGKFVLFFGSSALTEERKGMRYLVEALHLFKETLTPEEAGNVFLMVAGHNTAQIMKELPFEAKKMGFIPFGSLPEAYCASDAYLSPSTDDAGPSMVNQALSCGTPVVAFGIGTALDMVKDQGTGYCAVLRDSRDFAEGIRRIYDGNAAEFGAECRRIALERTTGEAFVKSFLSIWEKYQSE